MPLHLHRGYLGETVSVSWTWAPSLWASVSPWGSTSWGMMEAAS